jgi:hypothetical protein
LEVILKADRRNTEVTLRSGRRLRDARQLSGMLALFEPQGFLRVHRSHAVNLARSWRSVSRPTAEIGRSSSGRQSTESFRSPAASPRRSGGRSGSGVEPDYTVHGLHSPRVSQPEASNLLGDEARLCPILSRRLQDEAKYTMNHKLGRRPLCGVKKEPEKTTFKVDLRLGIHVVRNVPRLVWSQCRDEWIPDEVTPKLQALFADFS